MIELLTDDGKPFMAFEAYTKDKNSDDITLNLIALNEARLRTSAMNWQRVRPIYLMCFMRLRYM